MDDDGGLREPFFGDMMFMIQRGDWRMWCETAGGGVARLRLRGSVRAGFVR